MAGLFTREQREAQYRMGETIGGILKDRFHTKQAEDFTQNELQSFNQSTSEFFNGLSTIEDGDQMAAAFSDWKNTVFMPFITSATAKYSDNERIMNIVQQVSAANQNGMSEWMAVEEAGHQRGRRAEMEERATEMHEAKMGQIEAETGLAGARATEARARAGALAAEAETAQFPTIPRNADLGTAREMARRATTTHWKLTDKVKEDVNATHVSRILSEMRGRERGDGSIWGADPARDQAEAGSMWAASGARQKAYEAEILTRMGYDLNAAGDYYDDVRGPGSALLPEEKVEKLRAGAKESVFLARVLAQNTTDARAMGWDITSTKTFVEDSLPDITDYRQLGHHVTSILEDTVKRDADGQPIAMLREGNPAVKTYFDLVKHLRAAWDLRTGQLLDPSATHLIGGMNTLGDKVVQQYAPQIAKQLGIPVPKAVISKLERMSEGTALKLLRGATEAVEGLGLLDWMAGPEEEEL